VSSQLLIAVISVLLGGGFMGSLVQAFRARPERDAVVIVPWQKLNDALGEQNERLRQDWRAEREARQQSEALLFRATYRADQLERQLRALGISPVPPDLPPPTPPPTPPPEGS
jgi:hypothetical protein